MKEELKKNNKDYCSLDTLSTVDQNGKLQFQLFNIELPNWSKRERLVSDW